MARKPTDKRNSTADGTEEKQPTETAEQNNQSAGDSEGNSSNAEQTQNSGGEAGDGDGNDVLTKVEKTEEEIAGEQRRAFEDSQRVIYNERLEREKAQYIPAEEAVTQQPAAENAETQA